MPNPQRIPTGRLVWHHLMSLDRARSEQFFTQLFGWTSSEGIIGEEDGYLPLCFAGTPFGGFVRLDARHGASSHWLIHVTCHDIDRLCQDALALGGVVIASPADIPGVGRFAVVADPEGAVFAPFVPYAALSIPSGASPGAIAWADMQSDDQTAAAGFYSTLFDLKTDVVMLGSDPTIVLESGGVPVASIERRPPEIPAPCWLPYVRVADMRPAVDRAERLGGELVRPIEDVPGIGQIAWVDDPSGILFGLLRSERRTEAGATAR